MIFIKKDKDNNITGGYKVSFNIIHKFFILQLICIVLGLLFEASMLFTLLPLALVSLITAIPMFIGDLLGGVLGVIKVFKGEKISFYQMMRSVLITVQVLGWIFALLGRPLIDNTIILVYLFLIDFFLSAALVVFFVLVEVISDILLLFGLEKAGFALKSIFDKLAEYAAKQKSKEKEKVQ